MRSGIHLFPMPGENPLRCLSWEEPHPCSGFARAAPCPLASSPAPQGLHPGSSAHWHPAPPLRGSTQGSSAHWHPVPPLRGSTREAPPLRGSTRGGSAHWHPAPCLLLPLLPFSGFSASLQSAMVMFDLAWTMSKDLNDMLWYVVRGGLCGESVPMARAPDLIRIREYLGLRIHWELVHSQAFFPSGRP